MKLIISGATGYVATALIRQALQMPAITSLVVISRKPVAAPESLDTTKLTQILVDDYSTYTAKALKHMANANACIWTVAITPTKSVKYDFSKVTKVCEMWAIHGLKSIYEAGPSAPFRFVYISGMGTVRDDSCIPDGPEWLRPYMQMRGRTEARVLRFAEQHKDDIQVCVVKPGIVLSDDKRQIFSVFRDNPIGTIGLHEFSAAILKQVLFGFEKETILNDELQEIGQRFLPEIENYYVV